MLFFSVMKLTSYHVCIVKRNTIMRKKIHLLLSAISLGSSHGVLNLFFCLLITSLLGVVLKARGTVTCQVIFLFLRHNTCTFYSKMVAYLVLFSSYVGINSYIFLLVFEALWKFFFFVINHQIINYFPFLVTESVQLSRAVLLVNAECYTAWNAR